MSTRIRARHILAAIALAAAGLPLAAGAAGASQGGADDHKVTLCHRTNSETNPYVVITIDKAGVFKVGHDGHDEGGVWQPGDKAAGIRWGDIIPPFDYYASPQDQQAGTLSHYDGLNFAEGGSILANGCQVPTTEEQPPSPTVTPPSGSFTAECTATGALVDIGALSRGTSTGGRFELLINGNVQTVTSNQQDVAVPASATLELTYVKGGDTAVLQSGAAPAACPTSTTTTPPPTTTRPVTAPSAGGAGGTTTTTNAGAVLPETAVKGVKVGRAPGKAGAAPAVAPLVAGTQTGVLPRTGTSPGLPWVLAAGGLLLLTGAGLVLTPAALRRRR